MTDIYLSRLGTFIEKWKGAASSLGPIHHEILQLLVDKPYSTYQILGYFKNRIGPSDYKNAHRYTQKLLALELIQKANVKTQSIHDPIFFRLSEFGVYCLLRYTNFPLGTHYTLMQLLKILIKNYGRHPLLIMTFGPCFRPETVLNLFSSSILYLIWRYLQNCCEEIDNTVESLKSTQQPGEQILIWDDVKPGDTIKSKDLSDDRILKYLKQEFGINWLEKSEIMKFESDETLKISYRNNSITINLIDKKRKALLKINRNTKETLDVTIFRGRVFDISVPDKEYRIDPYKFLKSKILELASQLVLTITSLPIDSSDTEVLSNDERFCKLVEQTRDTLVTGANRFLKHK